MNNDPAPVVLFCYNRLVCLKETVEALQRNELASESDLFIYSDGPKQWDDSAAVYGVRAYLKTISGFKGIHIIEAPKNKGLANSIIDGVTEIVNKHGKIIVLEDDLVTSPYFLRFMNNALTMYEKEERVGSVCGFSWQTKEPLPETFVLRGADCWGWGTWKREWELFEKSAEKLLKAFEGKMLLRKAFDFCKYPYYQMLKNQSAGLINSWAVRWHASEFLLGKMCLYSGRNFIVHIGTEGTHVHSRRKMGVLTTSCSGQISEIPIREDFHVKHLFYTAMSASQKTDFLQIIRSLIRPLISQKMIELIYPPVIYNGAFPDWETACCKCRGYDSPEVLEKVEKTIHLVLENKAVFERDSVPFFHEEPNIPLTGTLLKIAEGKKTLNVLEFGGGLGSVFFQNRHFLPNLEIHWDIVEQSHFVERGQRLFQKYPVLNFFYTIEDALTVRKPDVILFSSVLQYLPAWEKILEEAIHSGVPYIFIDRTLFFCGKEKHRICIENVPARIYRASYAVHVFEKGEVDNFLSDKYQKQIQFQSYPEMVHLKSPAATAVYYGQFWERKGK